MDPLSFHALYESHSRHVYRYALSLCGNEADAEDITMSVFYKAWTGAPLADCSARAYLLAIARNLVIDRRRKSWREQEITARHEELHQVPAAQDTQVELNEALRALRRLPETYREPLELWAAGGLSYEEIAAALKLSVPVVKIRIHRARQMLAQELGRS